MTDGPDATMSGWEGPAERRGATPTTRFKARPRLLWFYVVFGCLLVVQGIATAYHFYPQVQLEPWFRTTALGLSVFVALLGAWFATAALRRLRDPETPITVGPAGLHDRALSEAPIAWRDIVEPRILHTGRGGDILAFDLVEGGEERAGVYRRVRATAEVNRRFGYGYQVHCMGTDAWPQTVAAAMAPYVHVDGVDE
jgi:hypothetical protein